uniref:Glucosamine-6-phosphate isomerase n=1 Tax=Meloidogyne enterolobii TaxID=390850 RepID=A0A6V7U024_MELEN|nr:unnamed protein product [Meloidogyne enterolobii]
MKFVLLKDYNEISTFAAEFVCKRIVDFCKENENNKKFFVLGLPTGSTPIGMYSKLVEFYKMGKISFKRVKTFNMDEYVGISPLHPQSYRHFMFENLFSHIDIDPLNIDIPNGQAPSLLDECNRYEEAIRTAGGIDLFVSGIGSDGHLAFNEPGSSLNSRTRVQALNNETILANSRFFQNDCSQVPIKAITVGVGTLMEAKEILVLASGSHKALAVHKAVEKGISHMCTASALQSHNNCIWLVDEEASQELKVKTVNFYRSQLPEYLKILSNITPPLHQQPCNITNNHNNKNCLN